MKLRTLITMMTTGTMLAASASAWADVSNRDNKAYTIDIVTSTGSHFEEDDQRARLDRWRLQPIRSVHV